MHFKLTTPMNIHAAHKGMPRVLGAALRLVFQVLAATLLMIRVAAYPPALPHTLYGLARDPWGNPLQPGATIILETEAGAKVVGVISRMIEPGVNYRLLVPLDAGLTGEPYKPTALHPLTPFRIKISVGAAMFLPIEMSHDFARLGEPGKRTLLNLTLGEDANRDGIPDEWQRRIDSDPSKVKPEEDADRDGLSNLDEYLAGTYADDSKSGFLLNIERSPRGIPRLSFMAIAGRTYSILGSADLEHWKPVSFRIESAESLSEAMPSFTAEDVRVVHAQIVESPGDQAPHTFKLMLK